VPDWGSTNGQVDVVCSAFGIRLTTKSQKAKETPGDALHIQVAVVTPAPGCIDGA